MSPTDLHDLAAELLAACEEALDTVPTYAPALGGAPERSFVTYGPPALDCCDQLTVHVSAVAQSDSGPTLPKAALHWINRVSLFITITRCVPVDRLPPIADQVEAAEQINADKWALWIHLHNLVAAGNLFDRCGDVVWGRVLPLQPSGGCGGSTLEVSVSFDGYEEILGT